MPQQQPIILNSKDTEKPQAIVVFLHGLGDTGDGWSYGFKDPSIRDDRVKYVFPTAATIPVSLNGGFPMTAWFDIYGGAEINGNVGIWVDFFVSRFFYKSIFL